MPPRRLQLRRQGAPLFGVARGVALATVLVAVSGTWASSARAEERYELTGETALAHTAEGLVQSYDVECVATDPSASASVRISPQELRAASATDQLLAVGVVGSEHPLETGVISGQYRFEDIVGARVVARLSAVCGGPAVTDELTLDTAPVTLPPRLEGPLRAVRLDTLEEVSLDALPVDAEVQLEGLRLLAQPFGDEVVEVAIEGVVAPSVLTFTASDVDGDGMQLSPVMVPTAVGQITLQARFLETVSEPMVVTAVIDDDDPAGVDPGDAQRVGCTSGDGAGFEGLLAMVPALSWAARRRRRGVTDHAAGPASDAASDTASDAASDARTAS